MEGSNGLSIALANVPLIIFKTLSSDIVLVKHNNDDSRY